MNGTDMTLELDAATAATVRQLSESLGVSPEEAVRQAIHAADAQRRGVETQKKLQALDALCRSLNLNEEKVARWKANVRDARR